jgi:hypothetical protein
MFSRTYKVKNSSITLGLGDITPSTADVRVGSDDFWRTSGGEAPQDIAPALGGRWGNDRATVVPAKLGEVVVTTAGNLPAKYLLPAITTSDGTMEPPVELTVRQTTRRALQLHPLLRGRSVHSRRSAQGRLALATKWWPPGWRTPWCGSSWTLSSPLYLLDRSRRVTPARKSDETVARRLAQPTVTEQTEPVLVGVGEQK